jgi:GPH family glycoside/pentoside/hexuronide:cation symporter
MRQEGIFYASRIFFSKAINGVGHGIAGVMLDVISFPQGARPGTVPASIIQNLGVSTGLMMLIPSAIAIGFYARYDIDKRRHARIREQLAARRAPPPGAPEPVSEPGLLPAAQN